MEVRRLPPQNKAMEADLLGILLFVPGAPEKVIHQLNVEDFYSPMHQSIYKAIINLFQKNEAIDISTVAEQISTSKENVDLYEITKLVTRIVNPGILDGYIRVIKEKSTLRQIANLTADFHNKAYDRAADPSDLLGNLISLTVSILQQQQGKKVELFSDVILRALNTMDEVARRKGNLIGIPSSIYSLSKLTLGYAAPDLTIIAAGASEGKSTLMLNEAKKAAEEGKKVAIFSLEMSNLQLMYKIFNNETNIDMNKLRTGKVEPWEREKLMTAVKNRLEHLNIFMYDIGGLSIIEFQSIVKTIKAKHGLDIVFVDYLQLMTTAGAKEKFGSRENQVSYISRQLKATCKNESIPIVALSQLSRLKEKRMYVKTDLRESGAIEQDADRILFIYRPKYHKIDKDENGFAFSEQDAFIQVEKERLGQTGIIPVKFNGRFSRFEDKNA